jgi:hypothetical protein
VVFFGTDANLDHLLGERAQAGSERPRDRPLDKNQSSNGRCNSK